MDKQPDESWEDLADRRIREAQAAGEFDNLPGFGQPIPGIDEELEDDWWLKSKLRREQLTITPPIIAARLARQRLLEELPSLAHESAVRLRVRQVNEQIRVAHFSPQPGPSEGVQPLNEEQTVAAWHASRIFSQGNSAQ